MSINALPSQWVIAKAGDLLDLLNGFAFKSKEYTSKGDFVIRIGNVQDGYVVLNNPAYISADTLGAEKFQLESGDILMSLTGNVGRVGIIKEAHLPAVLNQRVAKITPKSASHCLSKWIYYLFKTPEIKESLINEARGAAQLNISGKDVLSLDVLLPPLSEQQEIAVRLDTMLAQVDIIKGRLDALPTILKRFRQSVLAAAVSGKLTEEWRTKNDLIKSLSVDDIGLAWKCFYEKTDKRYTKPVIKAFESELPHLPKKWQWTQIGYVFDVHIGSTPSRNVPNYWNGNINWVSSAEVAFCRIKSTKEMITPVGLDNTSTRVHPPGTVMLAMIGQGKTRGQPAILDIDACHNQNTAALRVLSQFCIPEYLYYYLSERYEDTRRVGSGNNQQAMNKRIVQSLPFPLPPIEEQAEIVRRVEQLFAFADKVEQRVNDAQARVNHLTQSILAKAFRGELTADWRQQNPELISGENSAEALLARIQAERAAQKPVKRAVKKTATKKAEA